VVFGVLLVWSIAAHSIGAFWDDGSWNVRYANVDLAPYRLWSWTDNQLVDGAKGIVKKIVAPLRVGGRAGE